ncbi:hypothetical protein J2X63_002324 [Agromyces sp. 3263]|uniref:DUF6412 domain-containing protein n=1 Tax=Agromyces sp. 3263 TaxID=2817750 RepID=UPI0028636F4A|nr:DUF6412 domain-containing protein [Agromyces sp. 3263]MDR6906638.1 hypothetical protein [Agromyces sp. 3263]
MLEPFVVVLRMLQAAFDLAVASDAHVGALLVGVLGAAALALVVTAWRAIPALVAADRSGAATRLRQTADPGRLLAQSDPDAAGRPRPRAPGRGIPAA